MPNCNEGRFNQIVNVRVWCKRVFYRLCFGFSFTLAFCFCFIHPDTSTGSKQDPNRPRAHHPRHWMRWLACFARLVARSYFSSRCTVPYSQYDQSHVNFKIAVKNEVSLRLLYSQNSKCLSLTISNFCVDMIFACIWKFQAGWCISISILILNLHDVINKTSSNARASGEKQKAVASSIFCTTTILLIVVL